MEDGLEIRSKEKEELIESAAGSPDSTQEVQFNI